MLVDAIQLILPMLLFSRVMGAPKVDNENGITESLLPNPICGAHGSKTKASTWLSHPIHHLLGQGSVCLCINHHDVLFQGDTGEYSCQPCPDGQKSSGRAWMDRTSAKCEHCPVGHYSATGSCSKCKKGANVFVQKDKTGSVCVRCNVGASETKVKGKRTCSCEPGYIPNSFNSTTGNCKYQCPTGQKWVDGQCVGCGAGEEPLESINQEGPGCKFCPVNHYSQPGGQCRQCGSGTPQIYNPDWIDGQKCECKDGFHNYDWDTNKCVSKCPDKGTFYPATFVVLKQREPECKRCPHRELKHGLDIYNNDVAPVETDDYTFDEITKATTCNPRPIHSLSRSSSGSSLRRGSKSRLDAKSHDDSISSTSLDNSPSDSLAPRTMTPFPAELRQDSDHSELDSTTN